MLLTPLVFYVLSFLFFLILQRIAKEKQGLRLFDERGLAANLPILIFLHVGGILLFGLLPLLCDHPGAFIFIDIDAVGKLSTWVAILLFILSLIITPRILEKKIRDLPDNPFAHNAAGVSFYLIYFFLRIVFIGVYECWFRGYLLTDSIFSFGIVWAVVINIGLYAILHLVNGRDEVIACFAYGLLLCSLCIWQGAVWPAVVIHLALTIPYEFGFLRKRKTKISLHHENSSHGSIRLYR
jgi:membrane protease YdiL (CAAX protease family)